MANVVAKSSSWVTTTSVRPSADESAQQPAQFSAARRIERRRRLVHQQHRRIDRECARNRDALRLAARQLARQRAGAVLDAEGREQIVRPPLGLVSRRRRCACTGARQTLSSADRCSNRQ